MTLTDIFGDCWIRKCGYRGCNRVFIIPSDFDRHVKEHTEEEIWMHKCGFSRCNFESPARINYRIHMDDYHRRPVKVNVPLVLKST